MARQARADDGEPRMNGYERRTQRKREAILRAAQRLFTERGISDVSVGEIAREAGVSPVTVFNYFGDKMTLARETLLAYMNAAMADYAELLQRDIPFTEKVQATFAAKQGGLQAFSPAFRETMAWSDPALQQVVREVANVTAVPLIVELMEQGKREGAVDPSIPTEALLAFTFAFINMTDSMDLMRQSDAFIMGLVRLFFYGLIGK